MSSLNRSNEIVAFHTEAGSPTRQCVRKELFKKAKGMREDISDIGIWVVVNRVARTIVRGGAHIRTSIENAIPEQVLADELEREARHEGERTAQEQE